MAPHSRPLLRTAALIALAALQTHAGRALRAPLFKMSASSRVAAGPFADPDTLEVNAIYVQFKDETQTDNEGTTTGRGTFGSDNLFEKDVSSYALDPNGELRRYRYYLDKHFEFAKNYFEKVSSGRVTIQWRMFPEPDPSDGKITPLQLPNRMKAYNRSELDKDSKQKTADFNNERAELLMHFVAEALHKADAGKDAASNPFLAAKGAGPKKHECYLLFHAGHSRLLDGGQLGPFGADTPNDFTDFFVTKDDFKFLDSATDNGTKSGKASDLRKDSLGVATSADTVTEVMMLSESASQDKLNWGINGILVNQLARQMGMPDMFDIVKGISQLGYFDMMDFAGANSENGRGYLPVLPSAWVRYYMGWETPVVARPAGGGSSDYDIAAPGNGGVTTLKVPINDREYLLVENRQRAKGDTVTVYFSRPAANGDLAFSKPDSVRVPFAFADSIFVDSLCAEYNADKACKKKVKNEKRPVGVITGASDYDLSLPASGLLVWHVNEWFIEQFLRYGAVNAYLGDTLRSQYKGVELVEADGSPSIGKEFKDALGQPAFDYGSGSDMLPHIRRRQKDPPKDTTWLPPDTLSLIGPYGQANTNAWNDGRTHLALEAIVPANARLERGISSFSRDSIFALRDSAITLRVEWPDNKAVTRASDWQWPARSAPATRPEALSVIKNPATGAKLVVALSDSGLAQAFTATGLPALDAVDTLRSKVGYDSVKTLLPSGATRDDGPVPLTSLAGKLGRPIGSATLGDSVLAILTTDKLSLVKADSAGVAKRSKDSAAVTVTLTLQGAAGPLVDGDRVWVVTRDRRALAFDAAGKTLSDIALPDLEYEALAALPGAAGKPMNLVAAAQGGKAALIDASSGSATAIAVPWGDPAPAAAEHFTAATADFDRDGATDLFLLGSRGSAILVSLKGAAPTAFSGFPQSFPRRARFADTTQRYDKGHLIVDTAYYFSEDESAPALADLNGDGHPDIVFAGLSAVFAVDWHGAMLDGWPFLPEIHQPVGFLYGNHNFPEGEIQSTPLVLSLDGKAAILIGSPDGLIYAVDAKGKKVTTSSFEPTQKNHTGILSSDRSDWPLTMGGMNLDSLTNPFVHLALADLDGDGKLELLAHSGSGGLNAWTLREGKTAQGLAWTQAGGDAGRSNFLDVSAWTAAGAEGTRESIDEFFLFPSPLRGPVAGLHLRVGAPASKARLRVYDIAGNVVADQSWSNLAAGKQPAGAVDLAKLGPDVYTALMEVWFAGGKQKKFQRLGVIR